MRRPDYNVLREQSISPDSLGHGAAFAPVSFSKKRPNRQSLKEEKNTQTLVAKAEKTWGTVCEDPKILRDLKIAARVNPAIPLAKLLGIATLESTGINKKNPHSTADGRFGIVKGTMCEMIAKHGKKFQEIIDQNYKGDGNVLRLLSQCIKIKGGRLIVNRNKYEKMLKKERKSSLRLCRGNVKRMRAVAKAFQRKSFNSALDKLRHNTLVSALFVGAEFGKNADYVYSDLMFGHGALHMMVNNGEQTMESLFDSRLLKNNKIDPKLTAEAILKQHKKKLSVLTDHFQKKLGQSAEPLQAEQAEPISQASERQASLEKNFQASPRLFTHPSPYGLTG